jgi:AraC-like DNA-binding protein
MSARSSTHLSPVPISSFDPTASHGRFVFEDTDFLSVAYINADGRRHLPALEAILDEQRGRRPFFAELSALRLKELLLLLARSGFATDGSARTAERVVAYISEHYAEPLTNASIAAVFGHDVAYLGRAVKRYTGEPIHRLLVRRRVEGAIRLLLTTDEPLERIAEQVGFYGAAHLCAKCKALTGNPPSFYRRRG